MSELKLMPVWTIPPALSSGRDHLGMQAPSIALYSTLVPHITNVTRRVRYYSFFVWACDLYAQRKGDTSLATWQVFIRRAEALYALACSAHANGYVEGVAGINWAANQWSNRAAGADIDFSAAADPSSSVKYLQASYGAFGQIYQSALHGLELVTAAENHSIPIPGLERGSLLVKAFAQSVEGHEELFFDLLERGAASESDLQKIGAIFSPDSIPLGSAENRLLQEILLSTDVDTSASSTRRESLMLCLSLADKMAQKPSVSQVRWALYANQLEDGQLLEFSGKLAETAKQWQAYQTNELCHITIESLLEYLLERITDAVGVEELINTLVEELMSDFENNPETWRQFVDNITLPTNSSDKTEEHSEASFAETIVGRDTPSREKALAGIWLLGVLDKRWPGYDHPAGRIYNSAGLMRGQYKNSVMALLEFLRAREDQPLRKTLFDLFQQHVVERHLRIALRKLYYQGKRTFLFELVDGSLKNAIKSGPVLTNPRLETSLMFLRDLHLLNADGPTDQGRDLLKTL